jgi:hypothetical protein
VPDAGVGADLASPHGSGEFVKALETDFLAGAELDSVHGHDPVAAW